MATKRVNGEGCIRKKDATHWEARITLSRDPVTKKQKIKAFYGKSRKEVKEKINGTLMIISHQERILEIADEIVVISKGKVENSGPAQEILPTLINGSRMPRPCERS